MDDRWQDKTKRERKEYINLAQALYSAKPEPIAPKAPTKPKAKRSNNPSESLIQQKIVHWARNLGLPIMSIPNHGKRTVWGGQREVMMGLYKGASDLYIFRANNGYHGYFMELKSKGRHPTDEQYAFMERAKGEGYMVSWHDNVTDAQQAIIQYLDMA